MQLHSEVLGLGVQHMKWRGVQDATCVIVYSVLCTYTLHRMWLNMLVVTWKNIAQAVCVVSIRTPKPVENFYKGLLEPNRYQVRK